MLYQQDQYLVSQLLPAPHKLWFSHISQPCHSHRKPDWTHSLTNAPILPNLPNPDPNHKHVLSCNSVKHLTNYSLFSCF